MNTQDLSLSEADQKRQAARKALADAIAAKNARATNGAPIRALLPETAEPETAKPKKRATPANVALSPPAAAISERFMTRLEFCRALRIGETKYHQFVKAGLIRPVKIGRSVLVPVTEVDALIVRVAAA